MRGYVFGAVLLGAAFLLAGCMDRPAATVTAITDGGAGHVVVVVHTDDSIRPHRWDVGDDGTLNGRVAGTAAAPVTEACGAVDCYRVVPGRLTVQVSADHGATYTTAWQVTGASYRALAASYHGAVTSTSLVVHGDVVFVANGADGVLYRDAGGGWHRLGIPMGGEGMYWQKPHRLSTDPAPFDLTWYVVAFAALGTFAIAYAARRAYAAVPIWWPLVIAGLAAVAAWLIMLVPAIGMFPSAFARAYLLLILFIFDTIAVLALYRVRRPAHAGAGSTGPER